MSQVALNTYFESLYALKQSFFSDLFFRSIELDCPLSIAVDVKCRFLRLRLPVGQSLQLERVLVYGFADEDAGEQVCISHEAAISVSSLLPKTEHLLTKRCLLDPDHKGLGIHTDNTGQGEWILLDFGKVRQLRKVVVSNISSVWAWRAWKLMIESSDDGDAWALHYDHFARLLMFAECAAGYRAAVCYTEQAQLPAKQWAVCNDIMDKMVRHQYGKARESLDGAVKSNCMTKDNAAIVREGFSKLVLQNEQLGWSGHGILRPFRFWNDAEKQRYLEQAAAVIRALQEISPHVCFGFGMVLGYVRDGDLVPHDDDIDIIVGFDRSVARTISDALRLCSEKLQSAGYVVGGDHLFSHRWVKVPGGKNFDVFVGLCDGEHISWFPSARNGFLVGDVFPPLNVPFHGVNCPLPKSPVHYLDVIYGKKWRSPDPDFHHPFDLASYADLNK